MLLDGKIRTDPQKSGTIISDIDALTYVSTSVIAGFLGFQLLKTIASNFIKKMGLVDQVAESKIVEIKKRLEQKEATVEGMKACYLKPHHPEILRAIERLRKVVEEWPDEREPSIVLGRLYRREGGLTKAIEVLEQCRAAMNKGAVTKIDRAAVDFNLACYHCVLAEERRGLGGTETALGQSLRIPE